VLTDGGRLSVLDEPPRSADDSTDSPYLAALHAAGLAADRSESFGAYTATIASLRSGG
jgi:hypothetical protein